MKDKILEITDLVLGLLTWGNLALISGFCLSVALIWAGINGYVKSEKSKSWPSTQGTVTISYAAQEVRESGDERLLYYVSQLSYDYKIGDLVHRGDESGLLISEYNTREEAETAAEKYPVGSRITVYYNPDNTYESILEIGALKQNSGTLLGIGFFFLFLASVFSYMIFLEGTKR